MADDYRLHVTEPTALTIKHPDGRDLLVFHRDGTVTGDVEDAPEAARVLVREVRRLMGSSTPRTTTPEEQAAEVLCRTFCACEGTDCDHGRARTFLAPVLRAAERRGAERDWDEGYQLGGLAARGEDEQDNPYRERADTYAEGGERDE